MSVVRVASGNVLVVAGVVLMLLAGLGVLRLPDVFSRMHAGTKAASLGLALTLGGSALLLGDWATGLKLMVAIVFQFMTAPVAAHLIGRAAYRAGVPLYEGTVCDELASEQLSPDPDRPGPALGPPDPPDDTGRR